MNIIVGIYTYIVGIYIYICIYIPIISEVLMAA